jgi:hypothetical protein
MTLPTVEGMINELSIIHFHILFPFIEQTVTLKKTRKDCVFVISLISLRLRFEIVQSYVATFLFNYLKNTRKEKDHIDSDFSFSMRITKMCY